MDEHKQRRVDLAGEQICSLERMTTVRDVEGTCMRAADVGTQAVDRVVDVPPLGIPRGEKVLRLDCGVYRGIYRHSNDTTLLSDSPETMSSKPRLI